MFVDQNDLFKMNDYLALLINAAMHGLDIYALILCMISVSGLCLCLRDAALYLTAILIV